MSSTATSTDRTPTPPLNGGLAIGLVYLDRWPDLPPELTEREVLINGICTLLSNKPRASHLIHLLLQAPKEDVHAALRSLLQSGCIHIGRASTVPGTGSALHKPVLANTGQALPASVAASAQRPCADEGAPPSPSVLGKLWSKLSS